MLIVEITLCVYRLRQHSFQSHWGVAEYLPQFQRIMLIVILEMTIIITVLFTFCGFHGNEGLTTDCVLYFLFSKHYFSCKCLGMALINFSLFSVENNCYCLSFLLFPLHVEWQFLMKDGIFCVNFTSQQGNSAKIIISK